MYPKNSKSVSIEEAQEIAEKFFSIFTFDNVYSKNDGTLEIEYVVRSKKEPVRFKSQDNEDELWMTYGNLTLFNYPSEEIIISGHYKCNPGKFSIAKNKPPCLLHL